MSEDGEGRTYPFDPDWVIHPGDILRDELEFRAKGLAMSTWASVFGIDTRVFWGVLDGSEPVTDEIAERLSRVMGTSPAVWRNLERAFREGLAAGKTWMRDE